jgi:hypothetical protein
MVRRINVGLHIAWREAIERVIDACPDLGLPFPELERPCYTNIERSKGRETACAIPRPYKLLVRIDIRIRKPVSDFHYRRKGYLERDWQDSPI